MEFIKASTCSVRGGSKDRFPDALVTVAMGMPSPPDKPNIRISLSSDACSCARFREGERVDIGIAFDRGMGFVLIEAVPPDRRGVCTLHYRHKVSTSGKRLYCALNIRNEWKMVPQAIEVAPCDNEQVLVGRITARLPKTWERTFK